MNIFKITKGYFTLAVILLLGVSSALNAQYELLFTDDFESGTLSKWSGGSNYDQLSVIDDGTGTNNVLRIPGGTFDGGNTVKWVKAFADESSYQDHPIILSFDYYRDSEAYPIEKIEAGGDGELTVSVFIHDDKIFARVQRGADVYESSKVTIDVYRNMHIDLHFNVADTTAQLYVDNELLITHQFPAGVEFPKSYNYVTFSTYSSGGYCTLDKVELYGTEKPISTEANIEGVLLPFPQLDPVIDTLNATVEIPVLAGTNLASVVPVILVSEDAIISPESEVEQDFSSPVAYTVTSSAGNTKDWTITLVDTVASIVEEEHPFMVVTEDMYPDLRARYNASLVHNQLYTEAENGWKATPGIGIWYNLARQASHLGLIYILDDSQVNRQQYRKKLLSELARWEDHIDYLGSNHVDHVIPAGAIFNYIIALDIMYPDFTNAEHELARSYLEPVMDWMENDYGSYHLTAQYGVMAAWYIYLKDESNSAIWIERYLDEVFGYAIEDDGTYTHSPGYLHARLTQARVAKNGLLDVLDFTGMHNLQSDTQFSMFIDWMNTFSLTPYGDFSRFGESYNYYLDLRGVGLMYFAQNYSEKGGQNCRWHLETNSVPNEINSDARSLLNYIQIQTNSRPPTAEIPTSLLKEHSGAALWGREDSKENLQGVLYCLAPSDRNNSNHAKYDVNSLMINAYGQPLLVNSGGNYEPDYPGQTPEGGNWLTGAFQNVPKIGYDTQIRKYGDGLNDGIVGGSIEFGATSGSITYAYAEHKRALFMAHAAPDTSHGYFMVMDEVVLDSDFESRYFETDPPIQLQWQLNTVEGNVQTISANQEYKANADWYHSTGSNANESLSIFMGTEPGKVETSYAWKAAYSMTPTKCAKLVPFYEGGNGETVRIATVLFPEDNTHSKPAMSRVAGTDYSGVQLQHNHNVVDYFLVTHSASVVTLPIGEFQGKSLFVREDPTVSTHFTVYSGESLLLTHGAVGFEATAPVSINYEKGRFVVNCKSDIELQLYHQGLISVSEDGATLTPLANGDGWIQIALTSGSHTLNIEYALGVEEQSQTNDNLQISIFPNPVQDQKINIAFNQSVEVAAVSLYNLQGQEVFRNDYSGQISNGLQIHINKHLQGLYLLKVEYNDGVQIQPVNLIQ